MDEIVNPAKTGTPGVNSLSSLITSWTLDFTIPTILCTVPRS